MKWSLSLGKPFGIAVFVHWTFLILIAWIVYMNVQQGQGIEETLAAIVFVLAIFACVTFHEYGHALAARRYGIQTKHITLLPIGGVASLEEMPENPKQELVVAIAGPLVNVVIALILFLGLYFTGNLYFDAEQIELGYLNFQNFFLGLMAVNIILVVFNMIPAFPMDGGRVFRALLTFKMGRIKATNIAALLGQITAFFFVILGLFYNPFMIFIGIFVFLGAQAEANQVKTKGLLQDYTVREIMMTKLPIVQTSQTISEVVKIILDGQDKEFIVMENENMKGILTRNMVIKGLSEKGNNALISEIASTDFPVLSPDQTLNDVYHKMMIKKFDIAPVMENGELIGVLNTENISEFMMVRNAMDKNK
ncbi:MAG: site-2 protease family protein [Chitinophagaceae bacterium]|nr:MAG: site-2 protease family protein [Chitinophagaceae bacterium]